QARIDDYSLVHTIAFSTTDGQGNASPPQWGAFRPAGLSPTDPRIELIRTRYLQQLGAALKSQGIQLIVGYALLTPGEQANSPNADAFLAWLATANDDQVRTHVQDILGFFIQRNIPVDGIGFDIEINNFGPAHAPKLALLLTETARAFEA